MTPILQGIRQALDHLDELARASLRTETSPESRDCLSSLDDLKRVLREVRAEASAGWPGVSWSGDWKNGGDGCLPLSPSTLKEVLLILLHNAAEAMGGTGRVDVSASAGGPELVISVRDDGPGFSDVELERAFEPAFTTKADGHGFGLYLARTIVVAAGGSLAATRAPERGAVLSLSLPVFRGREHE